MKEIWYNNPRFGGIYMRNKSLYDDLESKEFIQKQHMLGYTKNVCCKKLGLEDKIILK